MQLSLSARLPSILFAVAIPRGITALRRFQARKQSLVVACWDLPLLRGRVGRDGICCTGVERQPSSGSANTEDVGILVQGFDFIVLVYLPLLIGVHIVPSKVGDW